MSSLVKPSPRIIGLDGLERAASDDRLISTHFAELFSSPLGKEVLSYLRSVSIEMVNGSDLNVNSLIHLEGQRYMVGLIERRAKMGAKNGR